MKKILVFSTNFLPNIGGAELAIKEIAERLPEIEFEVLTARLSVQLPPSERIGRILVHRVGVGAKIDKFLLPIFGFLKAYVLHRQRKYNLLWSMMASQASVAAAFFKIFYRHLPLLLTLQEGDEEAHLARYAFGNEFLYSLFIRPWHVLVFKVSDRITVISRYLEARARRTSSATPIVLIPNGVDVRFFSEHSGPGARARRRKEFGFSAHDWVVITVSRLVAKNRVDDCIRAVAALPKEFKLLIAGSGELEQELKRLTAKLGVSDRVVFAGNVENEWIPEYLAAADVFARPSSSEGFGISFIEAMAAGVPVIATPVGGITDFLEDKKTGLFCGVNDPRDLALKIQTLMRDSELRRGIIDEARQRVKERYDWDAIADRMHREAFEPLWNGEYRRVLIATGFYPPGVGSQAKYAKNLRDSFIDKGYSVSVVVYLNSRLPSGIKHLIYVLRLLFPLYLCDYALSLDTLSVGLPTVFAARLMRRKVIARIGGDFLWEQYVQRTGAEIPLPEFYSMRRSMTLKERLVFWLIRSSFPHYHRLAFNTAWQRELWKEPYRLDVRKTAVIENFYGSKSSTQKQQAKNFIWVGRPIKIKNLDHLKAAFERARVKNPSIALEFLSVPHEELMHRIAHCYAAVLPSLSDVSPNFIAEAIQYEKPFILTKYCGILNRVGGLGIVVDPLQEDEITAAFLALADDRQYEGYLKKLREFDFTHTWKQIAGEFIEQFKQS